MSKKTEQLDFAKEYDKLKKLLEWFESEDIDLAAAPKKYKEAQALAKKLQEYLDNAENSISVLDKDFDS